MQKIRTNLMQTLTKHYFMFAPSLALILSKDLLLKPKRQPSRWPSTKTRFVKVRTYKYGHGKTIWLIHGWSGSA
jgi:hypothetical protein